MSDTDIHLREDLLVETLNQNMGYYFRTQNALYKCKTEYQDLEIHEVPGFGRMLRLDGVFQTSDFDEFLYHEPLAHVPGIAINGSKTALVIGGGDGGAAEELLKYPSMEKVVMIELDGEVVEASKKYLPSISNGIFDSPRLELRIEDGMKYIVDAAERGEKFDQILLDLTDPFGPSVALYTKEFYETVNAILNPGGALSLHIESPITRPAVFGGLYHTLKSVFKHVRPMLNYVPMYGTLWSYASASQEIDPLTLTKEDVKNRIKAHGLTHLQFYNENTHFSVMSLPNYIENILAKEYKPFTKDHLPEISGDISRSLYLVEKRK